MGDEGKGKEKCLGSGLSHRVDGDSITVQGNYYGQKDNEFYLDMVWDMFVRQASGNNWDAVVYVDLISEKVWPED